MGTFQDNIKDYFKIYESEEITAEKKCGIWRGKEKDKNGQCFFHILRDKNDWPLNILPQFRDEIVALMERENIKKHLYIHHLNSSQAMCFNFFYPLIRKKRLNIVLDMFCKNCGDVLEAWFEKNSEPECVLQKKYETFKEPTNFDFFVKTTCGCEISFEIKYTEQEFGPAMKESGTFCFQKKYDSKYEAYKEIMPKCIVQNKSKEEFLTNYQLMRNLLHLADNKKHYVVFLVPSANKKIAEQAKCTKNWVTDEFKENLVVLYWEPLIENVEKIVADDNELKLYYQEFKRKYLFYI